MALRAVEWPKVFIYTISTCSVLRSKDIVGSDFAGLQTTLRSWVFIQRAMKNHGRDLGWVSM